MALEVRRFDIVVPAGTSQSAPATFDLSFPPRLVEQINVRIPPGPRGVVGFAVTASGQNVIPYEAGGWIIADNQDIEWPLQGQIDSGGWSMSAYNLGTYDHTVYVSFLVNPVTGPAVAVSAPLPVAAIAPPAPTGGSDLPPFMPLPLPDLEEVPA